MRGAGRKIAVMQVVGLDAAFDELAHQRAERLWIVVDALEQDRLAQHRDAAVHEPRAGRAGGVGQLARVVGVEHDIDGPARRAERADEGSD